MVFKFTKTLQNKIKNYNATCEKADRLQREIEQELYERLGIDPLSKPYTEDGNCPIYEFGTRLFDAEQIYHIYAAKHNFLKRTGEMPDDEEINEWFAKSREK